MESWGYMLFSPDIAEKINLNFSFEIIDNKITLCYD